uniref:uncharacterized protein LOC120347800 isoform X2 n=1 Tax=Styela clava TaxID=7725 RepID=UPI001939DCD2|nr:uncharacterized protein LOC120347800 isoform X2 [Styela clava]
METFKFIALFMCIGAANTVDISVRVRFRGSAVMTSYSNQETITATNEQELREKLTETLERALLDKQIEEVTIETDIYHGNKVQSTQVTKFDVTTADGLDDTTLVTTTKSDDITKAVTSSAARSSHRTRKADDVTTSEVLENVFITRSITSVASTHQESTMTVTTDVLSTTVPNGLEYDGKLFIPLTPLIKAAKSNKTEAESRCKEIGGQLANIYNDDHMDRIGDFIRSNFKIEGHRNFHLGMTYNENGSVSFRNGTAVDKTHFRWREVFPKNNGKLIYLRVTKNGERVNQFLWNWGDVEKFVLCER